MLSKKDFEDLADAAGSFAKGFKTLKKVLLRCAANAPVPEIPPPEAKNPDDEDAAPTPAPWKPPFLDIYMKKYGIATMNFGVTPADLLGQRRSMLWGTNCKTVLYSTLVGGKVRADRYKNAWLWDPSCKKSWRKISERQMWGIYAQVHEFYNAMLEVLARISYEEFYQTVGKISEYQWKRKHFIEDCMVTHQTFQDFVRDEHRRLPSVCGAPKKA